MPNSSPATEGTTATATEYNDLRDDVLSQSTGHTHNPNTPQDGDTVAHSSLSGSGTNTHAQIDTHIAESNDVHGLSGSNIHVAGYAGSTNCVMARGTFGPTTFYRNKDLTSSLNRVTITFGHSFTEKPFIQLMQERYTADDRGNTYTSFMVHSWTMVGDTYTGCILSINNQNTRVSDGEDPYTFHWMAIGTV